MDVSRYKSTLAIIINFFFQYLDDTYFLTCNISLIIIMFLKHRRY